KYLLFSQPSRRLTKYITVQTVQCQLGSLRFWIINSTFLNQFTDLLSWLFYSWWQLSVLNIGIIFDF
ncbi:MAG: hypothetical protein ACYTX0_52430, partial [Nostoc sp.]